MAKAFDTIFSIDSIGRLCDWSIDDYFFGLEIKALEKIGGTMRVPNIYNDNVNDNVNNNEKSLPHDSVKSAKI